MEKIMTKIEFDKFIDDIYKKISKNKRYRIHHALRTVMVSNIYSSKCGMARCHTDDSFNIKYGIALAYCRLEGIEFPKVKKVKFVPVHDLNIGDKFIYFSDVYVFLSKHPYKGVYYAIKEKTDGVVKFVGSTAVRIEEVE